MISDSERELERLKKQKIERLVQKKSPIEELRRKTRGTQEGSASEKDLKASLPKKPETSPIKEPKRKNRRLRADSISEKDLETLLRVEPELEEIKERHKKFPKELESASVALPNLPAYESLKHGRLTTFTGEEGFEEADRYWIEVPYSFAVILRSKRTGEYRYHLAEPEISGSEINMMNEIWQSLKDVLPYEGISEGMKDEVFREKFGEVIKDYGITDPQVAYKIFYYLKRDNLEYGKINPLLKDVNIEDISCDGKNVPIYLYHRKYYNLETNVKLGEELDSFVTSIAERCGEHLSYGTPLVESSLPDGSRVQVTLGSDLTTRGSSFSIRQFIGRTFTPIDLINYGTFNPEMLAYLWLAIEHGRSTMVTGGTASGKTSTLNALAFFLPPDIKIVTIEDTRELSLYQENWLPNVTRERLGVKKIDMNELVRIAMRQRPECLIIGEVRGMEARAMFQAISTGHTAFCTMHAGTVREAANRLQGDPMNISKSMMIGLDIVCLQLLTRLKRERVRRSQKIVEFVGLDPSSGEIRITEPYQWRQATDTFERVDRSNILGEIAEEEGVDMMEMKREIRRREQVLQYMADNSITEYGEISSILYQYYYKPDSVLEVISSQTGEEL